MKIITFAEKRLRQKSQEPGSPLRLYLSGLRILDEKQRNTLRGILFRLYASRLPCLAMRMLGMKKYYWRGYLLWQRNLFRNGMLSEYPLLS